METKVTAILTNEDGWQRQMPLQEGIHWLGSAREAQIFLNHADQIAPYHLQIVNHDTEDCLRLINLSGKDIPVDIDAQKTAISANGFRDVYGQEILYVGPYTLQFEINKKYIQRQVTREQQSRCIGLRLVLSGQVLKPDCPITGTLYLQNSGDTACQFEVGLEGLPNDSYEITPPPLIYAGGEETAEIHFYHRGTTPPAGMQTFTLTVSAPSAYPGREVSIQQTLKVMACYDHTLCFEEPEVKAAASVLTAKPLETQPLVEAIPASPVDAQAEPVPFEPVVPQAAQAVVESIPVSIPPQTPEPPAPVQAAQAVPVAPVEILPARPEAEEEQSAVQILPSKSKTPRQSVGVEAEKSASPAATEPVSEPVASETSQPEQAVETSDSALPIRTQPQKSKRPDLSAVKVIRASNGDFLGKRDDLS